MKKTVPAIPDKQVIQFPVPADPRAVEPLIRNIPGLVPDYRPQPPGAGKGA